MKAPRISSSKAKARIPSITRLLALGYTKDQAKSIQFNFGGPKW